jgi:hypothetical protein
MRSTCEDDNCSVCNNNGREYIPNAPDDNLYEKQYKENLLSELRSISKFALSLYEESDGYPITHVGKVPIEDVLKSIKKYAETD